MNSMDPIFQTATDGSAVADLLARRAQIQTWLERLDELQEDAPGRVSARVRADYEQRLQATLDALSSHGEAIRSEHAQLRQQLDAAGERYETVLDALAEAQLRFRIGELEESEWDLRRPELEAEVQEAASAREALAGEVARLDELLQQMDPAPSGTTTTALVHTPAAEEAEESEAAPWEDDAYAEPLPELQDNPDEPAGTALQAEVVGIDEAPPSRPVGDSPDDFAFLEELDRAIAASVPTGDEQPGDATRPVGVKCPDCGYTNDAAAWYCGVCGVDLS